MGKNIKPTTDGRIMNRITSMGQSKIYQILSKYLKQQKNKEIYGQMDRHVWIDFENDCLGLFGCYITLLK